MSETPMGSGSDTLGAARRPVGWREVFLPLGLIACFFVLVLLLSIAALVVWKISGHPTNRLHLFLSGLAQDFWFNTLLGDLFYLGLLALFLRRLLHLDPASLVGKFTAPPSGAVGAAIGVGAFFALLTIVLASMLASHHVVQFHEAARDRMLEARSLAQLLMLIVTVSVLAPLTEEFYFRNILLSVLKRKFGIVPAVVVSAILFALAHFEFVDHPGPEGWIATAVLFGLGVINAVWVVRTGFLWLAIASHAAYNAVLIVLPFALLAGGNS